MTDPVRNDPKAPNWQTKTDKESQNSFGTTRLRVAVDGHEYWIEWRKTLTTDKSWGSIEVMADGPHGRDSIVNIDLDRQQRLMSVRVQGDPSGKPIFSVHLYAGPGKWEQSKHTQTLPGGRDLTVQGERPGKDEVGVFSAESAWSRGGGVVHSFKKSTDPRFAQIVRDAQQLVKKGDKESIQQLFTTAMTMRDLADPDISGAPRTH